MANKLLERLKRAGIDRQSGIALYAQIREILRACIRDDCVAVGDQIPSEVDLAELFGVSRMTVRQAVDELVNDGMLRRHHGLGTLVASQKVIRNYNQLTSFYEDAQKLGLEPSSRLHAREVVEAPAHIADALKVKRGSSLIHLTRLRCTVSRVVSLNEVYISQDLCPWLLDEDLENQSLYELYEAHGLILEWGYQKVEATAATAYLADLLQVEIGSPLLYLERMTYAADNLPIEWVQAYSPSGVFSLEMTLRR